MKYEVRRVGKPFDVQVQIDDDDSTVKVTVSKGNKSDKLPLKVILLIVLVTLIGCFALLSIVYAIGTGHYAILQDIVELGVKILAFFVGSASR